MIGARSVIRELRIIHLIFIMLIVITFLYIFMASRHVQTVAKDKKILLEEGLSADGKYFTLQGQKFTILSGAIHYFRVPVDYWDDRLLKLKAMGLNTVET